LKTLKAKAKGEVDPAEYAALQSKVDELNDQISKNEKLSKAEQKKLSDALSEKDGALNKYLIEANLTAELVKAGVQAPMLDAVKALLQSRASINAKDGVYEPLLDGKPLAESVTAWAQSDQGKHFVSAPNNNGGGAQGGNGKGTAKTMTRTEFEAKSNAGDASLATFFREGGTLTE
jgi:hypothetical protein